MNNREYVLDTYQLAEVIFTRVATLTRGARCPRPVGRVPVERVIISSTQK